MKLDLCMVLAVLLVATGVVWKFTRVRNRNAVPAAESPFLEPARSLQAHVRGLQREWAGHSSLEAAHSDEGAGRTTPAELSDAWCVERAAQKRSALRKMADDHARVLLRARSAAELARRRLQYEVSADTSSRSLDEDFRRLRNRLAELDVQVAELRRARGASPTYARSGASPGNAAPPRSVLERFNMPFPSQPLRRWDFADATPPIVARMVAYNRETKVVTLCVPPGEELVHVDLAALCSADRLHVRVAAELLRHENRRQR